jgi:hypothetical protein
MSLNHDDARPEDRLSHQEPVELREIRRQSTEHSLAVEQDNVQRLYRDTLTALQQMFWDTMVAKNETIAAKDEIIGSKIETLTAKRQESLAKDELIAELSRRASEAESRASQALRCLAEVNQEGPLTHPNLQPPADARTKDASRRSWWRRLQSDTRSVT